LKKKIEKTISSILNKQKIEKNISEHEIRIESKKWKK
jgi:hypothetical protein